MTFFGINLLASSIIPGTQFYIGSYLFFMARDSISQLFLSLPVLFFDMIILYAICLIVIFSRLLVLF